MSVKIFFCYAREDELLLKKLKKHLKPLQREGLIDIWYDRDISAGTEWEHEISRHLDEAQIILLLISPDFMDSDYCYGIEMKRALERHTKKEALVIPIILRYVYWQVARLDELQALPTDATPVTSGKWHDLDEALYDIIKGIREVLKELSDRPMLELSVPKQKLPSEAPSTSASLMPNSSKQIEKPTYKQIQEAMHSQQSPYKTGGELILATDASQNLWQPLALLNLNYYSGSDDLWRHVNLQENNDYSFEYEGEACILACKSEWGIVCNAPGRTFSNFVYQIGIRFDNEESSAGLIFRLNHDPLRYYSFTIYYHASPQELVYELECFEGDGTAELFRKYTDQRLYSHRFYLFSVVAQENSIDLYANLERIAHIEDDFLQEGEIGIKLCGRHYGMSGDPISRGMFKKAKIWLL